MSPALPAPNVAAEICAPFSTSRMRVSTLGRRRARRGLRRASGEARRTPRASTTASTPSRCTVSAAHLELTRIAGALRLGAELPAGDELDVRRATREVAALPCAGDARHEAAVGAPALVGDAKRPRLDLDRPPRPLVRASDTTRPPSTRTSEPRQSTAPAAREDSLALTHHRAVRDLDRAVHADVDRPGGVGRFRRSTAVKPRYRDVEAAAADHDPARRRARRRPGCSRRSRCCAARSQPGDTSSAGGGGSAAGSTHREVERQLGRAAAAPIWTVAPGAITFAARLRAAGHVEVTADERERLARRHREPTVAARDRDRAGSSTGEAERDRCVAPRARPEPATRRSAGRRRPRSAARRRAGVERADDVESARCRTRCRTDSGERDRRRGSSSAACRLMNDPPSRRRLGDAHDHALGQVAAS